jgi:hypothetical protein
MRLHSRAPPLAASAPQRLRTKPGGGTIPVEAGTDDKQDMQDDRPTLKRREWVRALQADQSKPQVVHLCL